MLSVVLWGQLSQISENSCSIAWVRPARAAVKTAHPSSGLYRVSLSSVDTRRYGPVSVVADTGGELSGIWPDRITPTTPPHVTIWICLSATVMTSLHKVVWAKC